MQAEKKLLEMGINLPEAAAPAAMYIPVKQVGNTVYVSGQTPKQGSSLAYTGQVGKERTVEEGTDAARICTINVLAALKGFLGDLDKVKNVVKLVVFVNSDPSFHDQHIVANGASGLMFEVFGEKGRHARSAVGMAQLPLNCTVEVEAIVEV